jgi:thioredoxin-related protein
MKSFHRASIVVLLGVMLAGVINAQSKKPPSASDVLASALKTAKAEQKNVLIHFGASWCTWCKRLDAMLDSKQVGKLFHDNFVITHLTIQERNEKVGLENPGAQAMVDEAGGKGSGVPVYIFFDGTGKRLATSMAMPDGGNIGHPATPEEIQVFAGLLEKTAPRMTAAQRKQISDYLTAQKYD